MTTAVSLLSSAVTTAAPPSTLSPRSLQPPSSLSLSLSLSLTRPLPRPYPSISCQVAIKSDSSVSLSSEEEEEQADELKTKLELEGSRVRVTTPLKLYHVPKVPEFELQPGTEGVIKKYAGYWKGKRISANLPYKVEFQIEIEGRGIVKFFAHLKEDEFEFV